MHLFGANLDFKSFAPRPQYHRMDGLVAVRLRVCHVIVELVGQVTVVGVNDTERRIAILQAFNHNTHSAHIKQFIKRQGFFCILRQML